MAVSLPEQRFCSSSAARTARLTEQRISSPRIPRCVTFIGPNSKPMARPILVASVPSSFSFVKARSKLLRIPPAQSVRLLIVSSSSVVCAVAETIINNVRKTIIREQLTDPRFYAGMSKLLEDLIKQSRADTAAYEAFLQRAEELVKRMAQKNTGDHPAALNGFPGAIVLFNNLGSLPVTIFQCPADEDGKAKIVLELDRAMREKA